MTKILRIALVASLLLALTAFSQEPVPDAGAADDYSKATFFGTRFFELNDFASAYEQFARADAMKPDQPALLYNLGLLLAKLGRFSEAQVKVDRYVELYPAGAERALVNELQLSLEFQRELQRRKQVEQEYTDLFTRGRFHYSHNELPKALELFKEAEQRRPSDAAAIFNQAVVYERSGDFAKAIERYRRFTELENDSTAKQGIDQKVVALESELQDMETKIVCSFCGHRLPVGATFCHRCWHGPYAVSDASANARACSSGASVTRSTYFPADRFNRNETLSCVFEGAAREALRYTPARQKAIQDARKAEGWTYDGEVIQSWADGDRTEIRYVQGPMVLERIEALVSGEVLDFSAHRADDRWLLDGEEWLFDGIKYQSHYTFDAENRIAQQVVRYQNTAACNHLVTMTAEYQWAGSRLNGGSIRGGYEGFPSEGAPKVEWQVAIANTFDETGRLAKEELNVVAFTKMYMTKPAGAERKEVAALYPAMKIKRPMNDMLRTGDVCGTSEGRYLMNLIDLRPFAALSPNLSMLIPNGIARATATIAP